MKTLFFALGFVVLLAAGCRTAPEPPLQRYESSEPHMGTVWHITLYAPDAVTASNAVRAAFARVAGLDQIMTDYDPESELMRLCKAPPGTAVKVSADLFEVLDRAQATARLSGGAFDITVGPVVQLWRRARRQRAFPAEDRLAAARQAVGYEKLKLNPRARTATLLAENMRLDLGGIGKGYGADAALRVLRELGLPRALVAASGDLAIGDPPPGKKGWRVGVGAVDGGAGEIAEMLTLHNAGISTSGDAEQFVELNGVRYSHIVDPHTGLGLTNRLQATIVADCATHSDAMTKTVCVLGPERGLKLIEAQPKVAAFILLPKVGTNQVVFKSRRFLKLEAENR